MVIIQFIPVSVPAWLSGIKQLCSAALDVWIGSTSPTVFDSVSLYQISELILALLINFHRQFWHNSLPGTNFNPKFFRTASVNPSNIMDVFSAFTLTFFLWISQGLQQQSWEVMNVYLVKYFSKWWLHNV